MTSVDTSSGTVERRRDQDAHATGIKTSIIVPVLNETQRLRGFLAMLRERAPTAEIIVVCCHGSDDVLAAATGLADFIVQSRRGRAVQMNAGAAAANGDLLWFLHADCAVPRGCLNQIARVLRDTRVVGGCFRIRFPKRQWIYRISDSCGNVAVELFGRCYGDHGIFCRRDIFAKVGGYPEISLLEDAEFYRLVRGYGQTRQLASKIITSPRRYEELGPYLLTSAYVLISVLYLFGAPISFLSRIYERCCRTRNERSRRTN